MKTFNAILLVLLDIATLGCCGAIILVTVGLTRPDVFERAPWLQDRFAPFAQLGGADKVAALGVCGGLLLFGLLLLALELGTSLPRRRRQANDRDALGEVSLDDDLIRELAGREAVQVSGVESLRLKVKHRRTGLRLHGELSVDPLANLGEAAHEVQVRIRTAIERALGQRIEEVHLRCKSATGLKPSRADASRAAPADSSRPASQVR